MPAGSGPPPVEYTVRIDADGLLEINRLRVAGSLVSNAVHEINNALQAVGGNAELLGLKPEIGPAEQRRLQAIVTQSGRVSATLDRLASFTRATDRGRQPVDLAELAETALALRAFRLNRAHIVATVERAGSVPCIAVIDRTRILQVLLNLLLNAETALANLAAPAIHIRVERDHESCRVLFTDNGAGISAEGRAQLAGAAGIQRLGAGLSGLGLWASARIAAQHGGRLAVAGTSPASASLELTLPAVR